MGDVIVDDLTAGYVKAKFIKDSNNPTTVNEHIQRFKEIIRWGYQNDFVDNCSFLDKLVKLKDKSKHEKARYKFLEREECEKLLNAMSGSNYYLTKFLILSGCRVGEVLALTESDLSFETREISITKTKDPVTKEITTPKTAASVRQVYMQDDLYELCKEIVAYNKALKHRKGDSLFYNQYQEPIEYRGYNKYLEQYSEMVLGKKVSPHVLRHTHASILAENLDFEQIQRRLGHENSRITREIYIRRK